MHRPVDDRRRQARLGHERRASARRSTAAHAPIPARLQDGQKWVRRLVDPRLPRRGDGQGGSRRVQVCSTTTLAPDPRLRALPCLHLGHACACGFAEEGAVTPICGLNAAREWSAYHLRRWRWPRARRGGRTTQWIMMMCIWCRACARASRPRAGSLVSPGGEDPLVVRAAEDRERGGSPRRGHPARQGR